jgi:Flp pilus assembly protein TadG
MKDPPNFRIRRERGRRGAAAVELAAVLSLLCFLTVATCDYGRISRDALIVTNCARNGALYASDSTYAAQSGYTSIQAAALADANLSSTPTVSSTTGTDSSGNNYAEVTVSYTFNTLLNYPGIPSSVPITRTVRMAIAPP